MPFNMLVSSNDIFSIDSIAHNHAAINAVIGVNTDSYIFKGHFPGQPVVPGACMLQLVKDVLENALKQTFQLKKAGNIKFIGMIFPEVSRQVDLAITYELNDDGMIISAKITAENMICFKFQGVLSKA